MEKIKMVEEVVSEDKIYPKDAELKVGTDIDLAAAENLVNAGLAVKL